MNYYVLENEMRWRQAQLQKDLERSRLLGQAMNRWSPARCLPLVTRSLTPIVTRPRHDLAHRPRIAVPR